MTELHAFGREATDLAPDQPPRTLVPRPLTAIIGRDADVMAVKGLLVSAPLVTLTGPGGTGKTRLAIAVADDFASAGRETWFVDLSAVASASRVPGAIAAALGLRATARHPPLDLVARRVGSSSSLIVLDNMEHVVAAAPDLPGLLGHCPALRLLVTSRRPLRLSFERTHEVAPLSVASPQGPEDGSEVPSAVALFVDRARSAWGVEPSDDDLEAIADICARLGGLPLAIELAAARTRHLSIPALRARLEDPLAILSGGAADAPDRHRTLRETIAWSHGQLDTPAATMFARLGVFSGSFDLSAAHAVAAHGIAESDAATLEMLTGLADHSLLTAEPTDAPEPRFRMHALIREYAREALGDDGATRTRHLDHFLAVAEAAAARLNGPAQAAATRSISADLENLRGALDHADSLSSPDRLVRLSLALSEYWRRDGDLREGRGWLEKAVARAPSSAGPMSGRAERRLADIRHLLGDTDAAVHGYEAALEAARAIGDIETIVGALVGLARVDIQMDRLDDASGRLHEARAIADDLGDASILAEVRVTAGILAEATSPAAATTEFEAALDHAGSSGDRRRMALILGNLAVTRMAAGDAAGAVPLLEESIAGLEETSGPVDAGWAYLSLGLALGLASDLARARDAIEHGARVALAGAIPMERIYATEVIADWLGRSGAASEALRAWAAAAHERDTSAVEIEPVDRTWIDAGRERDRSAVPPSVARAADVAGRSLPLETAIAEGLDAMRAVTLHAPERARPRDRFALTKREREVLQLLADGYSDGDIAEELFISRKTASVHVANIKGKLGASSRVEIVTSALRMGLVEQPSEPAG